MKPRNLTKILALTTCAVFSGCSDQDESGAPADAGTGGSGASGTGGATSGNAGAAQGGKGGAGGKAGAGGNGGSAAAGASGTAGVESGGGMGADGGAPCFDVRAYPIEEGPWCLDASSPPVLIGCTESEACTDEVRCTRRPQDGTPFATTSGCLPTGWELCSDAEQEGLGECPVDGGGNGGAGGEGGSGG